MVYMSAEDKAIEQEIKKEEEQPKIPRGEHGRLLPGHGSLNPGGRPKDMRNAQAKLHKALRMVEKSEGNFLKHFIKQAFKDKVMAIALLKKIVPDLKAVEVDAATKETWQVILQQFGKKKDKIDETKNEL